MCAASVRCSGSCALGCTLYVVLVVQWVESIKVLVLCCIRRFWDRVFRALQCVAVRCSVLQCVAVRCSAVQRVAVCCSVLQCVVTGCCNVSQCVAVCCGVLQCVAVRLCAFRLMRLAGERPDVYIGERCNRDTHSSKNLYQILQRCKHIFQESISNITYV